jgi:hypothetical protein
MKVINKKKKGIKLSPCFNSQFTPKELSASGATVFDAIFTDIIHVLITLYKLDPTPISNSLSFNSV